MKTDRVAVILAEGFEETEAVTVIDVLRRAGLEVTVASLPGESAVTGAHELSIIADCAFAELAPADFALAVLPGGMPGSENLAASTELRAFLNTVYDNGGWVAAICAAPIALQAAGLLKGRKATCYPSFEQQLPDAIFTGRMVECDERIVTSRGVGTALEFALFLVAELVDQVTADRLRKGMLA